MLKRAFDIAASGLALLLLLPVMVIVGAVVARWLGRPIFYRQMRPGLNGRPFELIKFRTMTDGRDMRGTLLPDAERLTRFGRFLRASSLDELPELWNVFRGDMSLVGPRPLLMQYLPLYSVEQARRHDVRPGLTGYAQVMGRNAVGWAERLKLDVAYVDSRTFWMDLRIIAATVRVVMGRRGISGDGEATMAPFRGER